VAGRQQPGRGVYTCHDLACFERASDHRKFARVLRQQVRVGPELRRLYTGAASGVGEAAAARRKDIGVTNG
jgi:predicted RNA-binding protein YlxR (DUF448 family)